MGEGRAQDPRAQHVPTLRARSLLRRDEEPDSEDAQGCSSEGYSPVRIFFVVVFVLKFVYEMTDWLFS